MLAALGERFDKNASDAATQTVCCQVPASVNNLSYGQAVPSRACA